MLAFARTLHVDPFFIWLETSALSVWVRESPSVFAFPIILACHTVGMGFLAGMNAAIALRILGFAPGVPLAAARRVFPVLWAGFWLNAVSGVVLLIGYPTKALTNPVFYFKLLCVALGLVVQTVIRRRLLEDEQSEIRRVNPKTGEVIERFELPAGVTVSGLEGDGTGVFYCGGSASGKVRAVRKPRS